MTSTADQGFQIHSIASSNKSSSDQQNPTLNEIPINIPNQNHNIGYDNKNINSNSYSNSYSNNLLLDVDYLAFSTHSTSFENLNTIPMLDHINTNINTHQDIDSLSNLETPNNATPLNLNPNSNPLIFSPPTSNTQSPFRVPSSAALSVFSDNSSVRNSPNVNAFNFGYNEGASTYLSHSRSNSRLRYQQQGTPFLNNYNGYDNEYGNGSGVNTPGSLLEREYESFDPLKPTEYNNITGSMNINGNGNGNGNGNYNGNENGNGIEDINFKDFEFGSFLSPTFFIDEQMGTLVATGTDIDPEPISGLGLVDLNMGTANTSNFQTSIHAMPEAVLINNNGNNNLSTGTTKQLNSSNSELPQNAGTTYHNGIGFPFQTITSIDDGESNYRSSRSRSRSRSLEVRPRKPTITVSNVSHEYEVITPIYKQPLEASIAKESPVEIPIIRRPQSPNNSINSNNNQFSPRSLFISRPKSPSCPTIQRPRSRSRQLSRSISRSRSHSNSNSLMMHELENDDDRTSSFDLWNYKSPKLSAVSSPGSSRDNSISRNVSRSRGDYDDEGCLSNYQMDKLVNRINDREGSIDERLSIQNGDNTNNNNETDKENEIDKETFENNIQKLPFTGATHIKKYLGVPSYHGNSLSPPPSYGHQRSKSLNFDVGTLSDMNYDFRFSSILQNDKTNSYLGGNQSNKNVLNRTVDIMLDTIDINSTNDKPKSEVNEVRDKSPHGFHNSPIIMAKTDKGGTKYKRSRAKSSSVMNPRDIIDLASPAQLHTHSDGNGNGNGNGIGNGNGNDNDKIFACPYKDCDSVFTRSYNLGYHINSHKGTKPFLCEICKKYFARKSDCTRHKASIHGERKFQCCYKLRDGRELGCKKKFARKDALQRHLQTSTGQECLRAAREEEEKEELSGIIRQYFPELTLPDIT